MKTDRMERIHTHKIWIDYSDCLKGRMLIQYMTLEWVNKSGELIHSIFPPQCYISCLNPSSTITSEEVSKISALNQSRSFYWMSSSSLSIAIFYLLEKYLLHHIFGRWEMLNHFKVTEDFQKIKIMMNKFEMIWWVAHSKYKKTPRFLETRQHTQKFDIYQSNWFSNEWH